METIRYAHSPNTTTNIHRYIFHSGKPTQISILRICESLSTMLAARLEQILDSNFPRSEWYQPIWGMTTRESKIRGTCLISCFPLRHLNINQMCFQLILRPASRLVTIQMQVQQCVWNGTRRRRGFKSNLRTNPIKINHQNVHPLKCLLCISSAWHGH